MGLAQRRLRDHTRRPEHDALVTSDAILLGDPDQQSAEHTTQENENTQKAPTPSLPAGCPDCPSRRPRLLTKKKLQIPDSSSVLDPEQGWLPGLHETPHISTLHLPTPSPQRARPRRAPQLSCSIQMEHFCALGLTFFPKILMGRNIAIRSTLHVTRSMRELRGQGQLHSWKGPENIQVGKEEPQKPNGFGAFLMSFAATSGTTRLRSMGTR